METLRSYLKTLSPADQIAFAGRCGTTIGYLRKAVCVNDRLGETLAIALERESSGVLTVAELLPDFSAILKQAGYRRAGPSKQKEAA